MSQKYTVSADSAGPQLDLDLNDTPLTVGFVGETVRIPRAWLLKYIDRSKIISTINRKRRA
jgi:hypothetical protein